MSEVLKLAYEYKVKYGRSFDVKSFLEAARQGNASSLNPNDFMRNKRKKEDYKKKDDDDKKKKKPPKLKQNGGGFNMNLSDGNCSADGFGAHKGKKLFAKNPYELFMLMNQQMNALWDAEKTPQEKRMAELYVPPHAKNREKTMKDCFKAALDSNIILRGSLPKDREFYAQMKKEFFKNPKNAEKDWKRLTQFVPPAYLPVEKDQNKDQNKDNKKQPLSPAALAALQARAAGR